MSAGRPAAKRGPLRGALKSLRLRLSLFFAVFLAVAWSGAAFFAWLEARAYINEFFDLQQVFLARRLAETEWPKPPSAWTEPGGKIMKGLEDEALAFAVFDASGALVASDGKNGRRFAFQPGAGGLSRERLKGDDWRIVRLVSGDGRYHIAVGQELEYRDDLALDLLDQQLMPWLALLPVLLLGLWLLLSRELAPLRALAGKLRGRAPADASPLDIGRIPSEALPLAEALNDFFLKTNALLSRERSFVADAAHELRTPLAGLRVQAQVAAQAGLDPSAREEALNFLLQGIDRCARLVDQLLALSRLDALGEASFQGAPPDAGGLSPGPLDWPALLEELVREYRPRAEIKGLTLDGAPPGANSGANPGATGYPALVSLLLRNLLDNAVAYTPKGGRVRLILDGRGLTVENSAPDLPEDRARRLGERFFRPPGQEAPGSGLGLAIAKRIAEIHRFGLSIQARAISPDNGEAVFRVTLRFA